MTRLCRVGWVRFPHSPAIALVVAAVLSPATRPCVAQADTARADTLPGAATLSGEPMFTRPPVSPGRAFLRSLLLPGYGQVTLNRPNSATFYVAVEMLAIGMAQKSRHDLHEAKRGAGDSIPAGFTTDPVTGVTKPTGFVPGRFTQERINARRSHYEDWIAIIVFNHLIAAADAYVAANLWDFPGRVRASADRRGARVLASVSW